MTGMMKLFHSHVFTSAEAGRNPKPKGAFSSSRQLLTPGLKCSSTWNRSSEDGSYKHTPPQSVYYEKSIVRNNPSSWTDLIVILIQHDDYLSHVVEFSYSTQVVHGLFPLLVFLLLQKAA